MPMKINVGLTRKIGEANYGSRGASVNLELELDGSLATEPAKLQDRIRQLFQLVRSSLAEELNGGNGQKQVAPAKPNGEVPRPATQSQLKAIKAIAERQHLNLAALLKNRFQLNRPEELSIRQASQLIDELKSTTNGKGG